MGCSPPPGNFTTSLSQYFYVSGRETISSFSPACFLSSIIILPLVFHCTLSFIPYEPAPCKKFSLGFLMGSAAARVLQQTPRQGWQPAVSPSLLFCMLLASCLLGPSLPSALRLPHALSLRWMWFVLYIDIFFFLVILSPSLQAQCV